MEQLAEGMRRWISFVPLIFQMTHRVSLRYCLRWRFLFGFLVQSLFQTAVCIFLHAVTLVLGSICRSHGRNRTVKPELQRGSQGEDRKSTPFSLDNSSGEVGYLQAILILPFFLPVACYNRLDGQLFIARTCFQHVDEWALKHAQGFSCHCNIADRFAHCLNTFRPKYL